MAKFIPQLFMLAGLIILTACSPVSTPGVDPAAATAAYETEVSVLVTQAFATLQAFTPESSATPSLTLQPPAATPTRVPPTSVAPLISVSVDTNCRRGPGQVYDYLGGLMVGETAQILARDPSGLYWYIQN